LRYQKIAELNTVESIESFHRKQFSRTMERVDGVELPSSNLELQICEICQSVLYINDLGLSDSFRDLGCSSLQFVRICARIKKEIGVSIAVAETFALATMRDLVQLVANLLPPPNVSSRQTHSGSRVTNLTREAPQNSCESQPERNGHEIAIIGMAGRFPGANDVQAFWQNLLHGIESIETLSEAELNLPSHSPLRTNPNLVRRSSYIKDADQFDARFFGVFPKEAAAMDPQHRLLLEECYHALEDAGYVPDQIVDSVGVFAGCYMDTYVLSCLETHPEWIHGLANSFHGGDLLTELGNDKDYLATRISFLLNLRGPALTIQTACSTSLVAIIQACQSLQSEQCRMALAGGVTLKFPQKRGYLYTEGGMVSPEGKCRTFDAKAKGTIFGEGVAVVVLKRLEHALQDGDSIYAVLKGWGINNDGRSKAGYTAPSIAGQTAAIALAHQHARINADSIQYVEAHGTGTALGDPIEIEALTRAFRRTTDQKQYCRIGSAKTNIGHLDVAAGACGLIKASLALQQEQIPPTLNFETPNPNIDFANSPFVVNTQRSDWPRTAKPRRAGLSSFGVGGTNAHVVIEEAPLQCSMPSRRPYHILNISARSESALANLKQQLRHWLSEHPTASISDVCYTLNVGRKKFNHSWASVVSNHQDALQALSDPTSSSANSFINRRNVPIVFAFPGQGSQFVDMGLELYQSEPVFAEAFDQCVALLLPDLQFNLRDALFASVRSPDNIPLPDINQTIVAQPGIFAVSYATARWLQSLGLTPVAMIGHSVGEFVAACLSGIFTLKDALKIIAYRARRMQQIKPGHMLAVRLGEDRLLHSLSYQKYASRISLAAVNSPQLAVLSGEIEVIESLQLELEAEGIISKVLKTSHAFHSWMMDSVVEPLAAQLRTMTLHKPKIKIVSTVTGNWLSDDEALSPDYWAKHLRETVRFSAAAETILAGDFPIILEVGPGQTVSTLVKQHKSAGTKTIHSLSPHVQQNVNTIQYAWQTLARIWQAGADIQLGRLYREEIRLRVNLPGYPFERQRFWFDQLVHPQPLLENPPLQSQSSIGQRTQDSGSKEQACTSSSNISPPEHCASYAQNAEYSVIVQQVIRQQLEIMSQQLKFWHQG
jgi:acyl transferase domain-containing protein/acyl carrier protein